MVVGSLAHAVLLPVVLRIDAGKHCTNARMRRVCVRAEGEASETYGQSDPSSSTPVSTRKRTVSFSATKSASIPVKQGMRPLQDYMALPVSQYSVLDARKIERLSENTFKVPNMFYCR